MELRSTKYNDSMLNKRAVLKARGAPYEIVESEIPSAGPGEALVRLTHSGCCFTDTKARWVPQEDRAYNSDGDNRNADVAELVGGHEGIGTIVELNGLSAGLKIGQRVGMGFLSSTCQQCEVSPIQNELKDVRCVIQTTKRTVPSKLQPDLSAMEHFSVNHRIAL
jgi:D-arabinose 1-dehydrogenase-like Zn-dependent alcohol dehydrogenase